MKQNPSKIPFYNDREKWITHVFLVVYVIAGYLFGSIYLITTYVSPIIDAKMGHRKPDTWMIVIKQFM